MLPLSPRIDEDDSRLVSYSWCRWCCTLVVCDVATYSVGEAGGRGAAKRVGANGGLGT
ncbi:BQ5605_C003g02071 [Microbotryum silenes-dioicae]|uniref:BQ5605_C003g02071 protein n=1 Tax=Microbotryum silenes-dioicae TaxID=796604 RepID=A0A2X0P3D4_9BASI|nr:BQ5605_C003g02071 [Microbotryum silenes-dioicae]